MNRRLLALLGAGLLLAAALPAPTLAKAPARTFEADGKFIVQMAQDPVVAYTGGVKGLKATAPKQGQKIDPLSSAVTEYVGYLQGKHDEALKAVGGKKFYDYVYAFNGFAAKLTAEQANKMAGQPGVVAVTRQKIQQLDTSTTPDFLGLSADGGLWDQLGGTGLAGDGVIVGIVDSGIWPENPSFSDRVGENGNATKDGKLAFQQIPGWHGKCTPGEAFTAADCNQKLIGAQWFDAGYGGPAYIKSQFPAEFISARDADGHGSHTSSTAAGNYGVPVTVEGNDLGMISGMAPHARIATYKVCWGYHGEGGCANSDSVAAIDQAVADGVDVINFSISGSQTSFADPVEIAFLFAARAGIFVAASAGNAGTDSSVAHNSPWLTTVAAGTHDRQYLATATLGNGATYTGAGLGAAVPSSPLIAASAAGVAGADADELRLCFGDADGSVVLDPAKVEGKIVVCDRGVTARVNKSLAVKEAGGVGMILVNTGPSSLNADLHFVPTVHLPDTDRAAILAYAAMDGATASISAGVGGTGALAPDVAGFSSRGPARAGGGDLLKPDIMAPGNDILAAVSPNGYNGHDWDFLSGTSMSSPHMAGLAALLKQAHPTWSPAAIKSAFMTTASTTRNDGSAIPGTPFGYGAGQVVPNSATDPGLVYNAGWNDWLAFLCGNSSAVGASTCNTLTGMGYSTDASNLNYPSIAIGDLAGVQTVTRKVTNVSGSAETYTASVTAPAGIKVDVTPATLSLTKGESKSFTVTFTTETAALNAYAFGSLTWEGSKGHMVTSPLVVKPVALAAPASVTSKGADTSYSVTFGYTGPFTATARGLVAAMTTAGTVDQDPDQTFDPADATGTVAIDVEIPAGTTYARFETFDADVAEGTDLDVYVYKGTALVGLSAGGTSAEQVNLANPAAGTYTVFVHGWGVPAGTSPFVLHSWAVPTTDAGNMTVSAPASATTGATGTISLSFSGLTAGTKYLGQVAYGGMSGMPAPTIVSVNP